MSNDHTQKTNTPCSGARIRLPPPIHGVRELRGLAVASSDSRGSNVAAVLDEGSLHADDSRSPIDLGSDSSRRIGKKREARSGKPARMLVVSNGLLISTVRRVKTRGEMRSLSRAD